MAQHKLVIAEKPSVAQNLAAVIGATVRKDGYLEGNGWRVSWCVGHLAGLADADSYDPKYAKWRYDDLPILPEHWQMVVGKDKKKQFDILKKLMNVPDVSEVVNACDAGREGELIFRSVYELAGCKKPMKRLWISSMEDSAIREGFANLRPGADYDGLRDAALCRAKADWLVGINATRLFSVLYHRTLNIGRVMSPTLALIVQREGEIDTFQPVPFYTVALELPGLTVSGERMADKAAAEQLKEACQGVNVTIKKVECKEKSEKPPALYDLTTLQRDANRLLGFTAQQTLDYLQSLYEKKLCTYPRTDSRYLTGDMADSLPVLVNLVANAMPFRKGIAITCDPQTVINDKKVTDHHAVIPTRNLKDADLSALPAGEKAVLELVALRLMCAVAQPHIYSETVVIAACAGGEFTTKGKTVKHPGWKALEDAYRAKMKDTEPKKEGVEKALPELTEGQTLSVSAAIVKEGKLIAQGMPADQIAFIHEANTEVRKKELFSKVRTGQVRVLLGSTAKMGAGTNVQDRLVALHDLDCPWRPGDLAQRKGRIERQGNQNPLVHVYRYVTEGTFDAYLWQTVENKQKFISQIMTSKSPVRSCDDVDETALSFAEIKALCAGDPRIKERMDLDVEVSRLKLMKADHQSKQYRLEDQLLKYFPEEIEKHKGFIKGFESDLEVLAAHPHPEDGFAGMEIRGDLLTDKENAGAALLDACKEVKTSDPVQIGSYRGYAMSVEFSAWKQEYTLLLKGQMTHRATLGTDPRGNLTRIDNALAQMPQRLEAAKAQLDNLYQQQAAAKEEVGKPFLYEEELRSKNARLVELDTLLNIDGKGQAHAEAVVAKSARPSVLDHLKRPATPRSTDKKPKQHEEVR